MDPEEGPTTDRAAEVIGRLHDLADPVVRADLGTRYGIHTDRSLGVPMRELKDLARAWGPDHALAGALWDSGWYEARTVAVLVDDPEQVTAEQMQRWASDFDNWAIVDTACFNLFDRTAHAWDVLDGWVHDEQEFVRRAGYALLWALALHDKDTSDERFAAALPLLAAHADDERPLVGKAITMAMRAIATKHPALTPEVLEIARAMAAGDDRAARRVAQPILKAFG